jgi:SAM-dependent methyltransferase
MSTFDYSGAEKRSARTAEDEKFRSILKDWILRFHSQIRPLSDEEIEHRVSSYVNQEDQYREKVRFILQILADRGMRPDLVLDLGSSAGGLSVALSLAGTKVVGVEPSPAGVDASVMRAAQRGAATASFMVGVGEKLPFPANTFDAVVSLAVLEHVQDTEKVVRETFRVLKPGGYAYFEVPNYLFPFEPHYKIAWFPMMPKFLGKIYAKARGGYPTFLDELNYMNTWLVSGLFRRAGFVDLKDLYASFLAGKATGAPWAEKSGRLARMPWSAGLIRAVFTAGPAAWFLNRAIYLIARKPS